MRTARIGIAAALMAALWGASPVIAVVSEPVGFVKTVDGQAWVLSGDKKTSAVAGAALQTGDTIQTDAKASMGITFKDNTIMSLGPETTIVIDEYLFAPGSGDLKLGASLSRGTLNYISGLIAKLRPDAVNIKTPTGTIGVRGTHFLAKVEPTEK